MLTAGFNHVAVITGDTDAFVAFYRDIFDARVIEQTRPPGGRVTVLQFGERASMTVFEIERNTEASRQEPMFGRGRLDHFALEAADPAAFAEIRRRLSARQASDDVVTDFGAFESVFARDPDGMSIEVCCSRPGTDLTDARTPDELRERALV